MITVINKTDYILSAILAPDIELVVLGRTEMGVKGRDVVGTLAEKEFHVGMV